MSMLFKIKNKKSFFHYQKILTLNEIKSLLEDLIIYEVPEDEDKSILLSKRLNHFPAILLGVFQKSVRGFLLSYEEKSSSYAIDIFTASTHQDWLVALEFMSKLAKQLGSNIETEEGEIYTYQNINLFNYQVDIEAGVNFCSIQPVILSGVYRPITFTKEMCEKIRDSKHPIKTFEKILYDVQYINAYEIKPRFVQGGNEDEIIGIYTFISNIASILPNIDELNERTEKIENENNIKIQNWIIELVNYTHPEDISTYSLIDTMEYEEFLLKLKKEHFSEIDGALILVKKMSRNTLKDLSA